MAMTTTTTTTRIAKELRLKTTSADQDKAYALVEAHNVGKNYIDDHDNSRFVMISNGKKSKMFTLWSFFSLRITQPYQYIANLSTDLVTAVEKTIEKYPSLPIQIDQDQVLSKDENNAWMFLTFGKYKGHHIDDVIADDSSYSKWLLDNNMKRCYEDQLPMGKLGKYIIGKDDEIMTIYKEYRQEKAEKLSENMTGIYVGVVGEKSKFDLTVKKVITITNSLYGDSELFIMEDKDGNSTIKFGTINVKFIVDKDDDANEVKVGDRVQFTGMVKAHKLSTSSNLGEKQTTIGRLSKFK